MQVRVLPGEPKRSITARYGSISRAALPAPQGQPLAAQLVKGQEAQEMAPADNLLAQARSLQEKALSNLG